MSVWKPLNASSTNHKLPRSTEIQSQFFTEGFVEFWRDLQQWSYSDAQGELIFIFYSRHKHLICFPENYHLLITLQGQLEQTKKRQKSIAESPMAKLCESQMMKKNYLLPACRNVTESANNLDQYRLQIALNNVTQFQKNNTYVLYSMARHLLHPYAMENVYPQNTREDTIDITVNLNEQSTALNMTMETPLLNVNLINVRLSKLARTLLNVNPARTLMNRIGRNVLPLYYERKLQF
jgi:hypothetical protein